MKIIIFMIFSAFLTYLIYLENGATITLLLVAGLISAWFSLLFLRLLIEIIKTPNWSQKQLELMKERK